MKHRLTAQFRFYEELNDFLPVRLQRKPLLYHFSGTPGIKDAIEAIGIPHTEIDLILVNGISVDFSRRLSNGDRVSVYPVFESFDISPVTRLRPRPLRNPKFLLDEQLGKLAPTMRLLGLDSVYCKNRPAREKIEIAEKEKRIILTRTTALLKNKRVTRGYWVRSSAAMEQAAEVLKRFDLYSLIKPFSRCLLCNGCVEPVEKRDIEDKLPPRTREAYNQFFQCRRCLQLYWKGSHYRRLKAKIEQLLKQDRP